MTAKNYQAQHGRGAPTAPASPYDDPAVSAGEIADYLHAHQSEPMSFTSPPDLSKLGLPQTLAEPLMLPNTSADIIQPRKLGMVHCINVARLGEPIRLRYFGASAVCAASGQAHPTQVQAEADVLAWADGQQVAYEQHAVVLLGSMATQPMTELQAGYRAAVNAVRAYAKLVQAAPPQQRPPMLFVAEDICDGETCDCVMSGKISAVSDALASACVVGPSLAAAIVVCAEAGDVTRAAMQYLADRANS